MTFGVVPAENFWEKWNIQKGSPVFLDGIFQMEIWVPFLPDSFRFKSDTAHSSISFTFLFLSSLFSLAFLAQFVSLAGC